MSRGGGLPPLGDTDGEPADGWMSDANNGEVFVFARSAKVQRSPVSSSQVSKSNSELNVVDSEELDMEIGQLFTPKANSSRPRVAQQEVDCNKTRAGELKKKIDELYDYIKGKHNVHQKIRLGVTGLKTGIVGVERELQAWKARAEKAEKELEKIVDVVSESSPNPRTGKRDRDTPGEVEAPKKQRDDSDEMMETEGEASGWQTIKNKNEKKEKKMQKEGKKSGEKKTEENEKEENKREEQKTEIVKKVRQRIKGDALIVEVKGTSYAELLRKVKTDPELKELGENVIKTRRTQRGEMLFELKKDPTVKSMAFKQLVERSLGEEANVRALSQETVVECKDLDAITTEDELREAIIAQCGLEVNTQMTIRMRKAYGGTQIAVIRLSIIAANKVLEKGKIKVGWSICHLKVAPRVTKEMERCFKCMGFGHHARNCDGPDRSKLCRKCGEEGHFANDCAKPPSCMLCQGQDGNGHVTGGFKCPAYKKAMANQQ